MTRRQFMTTSAAATLAAPALGCGSAPPGPRPSPVAVPGLDDGLARLLGLAALAPSSHNAQPWAVRATGPRALSIAIDPERRLPEVDPAGREILLSLGCFVENLAQASAAEGLEAEAEVAVAGRTDPVVGVRLVAAPVRPGGPERIRRRRTLRAGHLPRPLAPADVALLMETAGPGAAFFPRGAREARAVAEAAVEAMRRQTWRDPAQRELARWLRFRDEEVARRGDGLTVASMEAGGLAGFVLRHFFDQGSAMGRRFREQGIELCARQAAEGGGFVALTSTDASAPALLDAGRRFERMALRLRERSIAAQPMSQALEETPWRDDLAATLGLPNPIQFLVRVGYVDRYPAPVSPRRALASFVTTAFVAHRGPPP
jgi:nitroreductase